MSNPLPAKKQPSLERRGLHRCPGHLLTLIALMAFGAGAVCAAGKPTIKEYQLKAAFLYNFTKFVEWPAHTFVDGSSPIVIGAYCPASFGADLEKVVKGRKVNGRSLVVRTLASAEQVPLTQLLFLCASEDHQFDQIKRSIGTHPVLTVGESDVFANRGGMIVFVMDDDRVRFEINAASAERSGLRISAQLQKLASTVRKTP